MHIAIIDSIGLKYNGNTVFEKGLGGSESAVTFMAQYLVDNGFYVDVNILIIMKEPLNSRR